MNHVRSEIAGNGLRAMISTKGDKAVTTLSKCLGLTNVTFSEILSTTRLGLFDDVQSPAPTRIDPLQHLDVLPKLKSTSHFSRHSNLGASLPIFDVRKPISSVFPQSALELLKPKLMELSPSSEDQAMELSSTKKKRRLKMNKHKQKKRRKRDRNKNK